MNPPKCNELDYINFLIAAQRVFSTVEAAETSPDERAPAHDAYTRLLQRLPPDSTVLWSEVEPLVQRTGGVLVIDDSTLDKPYASKMALVTRHWSGKHGRVVQGINLISLVWTDCEHDLFAVAFGRAASWQIRFRFDPYHFNHSQQLEQRMIGCYHSSEPFLLS